MTPPFWSLLQTSRTDVATVKIDRGQLRIVSTRKAARELRQAMFEVVIGAQAALASGPYTSGNLARSIRRDGPHVTGDFVTGSVGSDLLYAASVHGGAEIHDIFPKAYHGPYRFGRTGAPKLKFYWRKAGRVIYPAQIPGSKAKIGRSHPGQEGKFYLTEPLRDAARRHRMKVAIID